MGASAAEIIAPKILISVGHIIRAPVRRVISKQRIPPSLVKTARASDKLVGVGSIVEIAVSGTAAEVAEVCDNRVVDGVVIQVSTNTGAAAALVFEIGYRAVGVAVIHLIAPARDAVGPVEGALDVELGAISQGAALFAWCLDVFWGDEIADEGVSGIS